MGEISEKCPRDAHRNPFTLRSYLEIKFSRYRWYLRDPVWRIHTIIIIDSIHKHFLTFY
jgi:hypothetical protein